ncbi:glutamine synthetase [candidate division WOR-3 bacterium]|jgi:glutamine synthetase|nr:glutamine synthetase [candidate division WOR-3 bacterium]NOR16668.1 glutamine synthetase [candidate division WOR-3 bacterium]
MTIDNIFRRIEKEKIRFIDLWFSDILGSVKNETIPVRNLKKALKEGIWFDGSSVEGFGRIFESDMYLKPDPQTFAIIPWGEERTARFICDVYAPDHKPAPVDPRAVLKNNLKLLRTKGMEYYIGAELEFYLFCRDGDKVLTLPHDRVGYFDLGGDLALRIRKQMCDRLEAFGIDIEAGHHEVGRGQHEIDLLYTTALKLADNVLTARMVIKKVAEENNLYATFMPKPIFGAAGNGMHIHQSIFKGKKNQFSNPKDSYGLSKLAYNYLAGVLKYMKEISAVTSPLVNSYKRLVSGFEAPVYICWGRMNRSALVRVPRISRNNFDSVRIELRSCDPSANPYLLFASVLRAGLEGIKNNLKPPKPVEENVYKIKSDILKDKGIGLLPRSLWEALEYYNRSKVAKSALGDVLFQRYYDIKLKEWDDYSIQVSKWEQDKYLELY